MIEADIRRKFGSEDVLTSCCIGLLELLPESYLLGFLNRAVNLLGDPLLSRCLCSSIGFIEFWPRFSSGYPDVVVTLKDGTILIIEIKHGAGKHGSDSKEDSNSNDKMEIDKENRKTRDQLAKYWCDARKDNSPNVEVILIYLTHHRSIPKNDLEESEKSAKKQCGDSDFYWLNWFTLFFCASDWLSLAGLCYSEKKILELLRRYLTSKGYACFLGWGDLPTMQETNAGFELLGSFYLAGGDNKMNHTPTDAVKSAVAVLEIVDKFYGNCGLMFENLCGEIMAKKEINKDFQKSYTGFEKNEKYYGSIFKSSSNQQENKYYFCFVLLQHKFENEDYKAVCEQLKVNTEFPLLLVIGKFEPRSLNNPTEFDDAEPAVHKSWMYNTLMTVGWDGGAMKIIDGIAYGENEQSIIAGYEFKKWINLSTTLPKQPDGSYFWCLNSTFMIYQLMAIRNKDDVAEIAGNLLKFCQGTIEPNVPDDRSISC